MQVIEFQDAISAASQVAIDVLAENSRTFSAAMQCHAVGRLSVSDIACDPVIIERSAQTGAAGDRYFVLMQLEGTGCIRYGDSEFIMTPGDFFVADSAHSYQNIFQSRVRRLVMRMERSELLSRLPEAAILCGTRIRGDRAAVRLFCDLMQGIMREMPHLDTHSRTVLGARAVDLLALAVPGAHDRGGRISGWRMAVRQRILAFIEDNLSDSALDTRLIAQAMQLSPRYVQSLFKASQTTVRDHIRERRLQRCYEQLVDRRLDHMTVSEIAFAAGFNSFEHFCRSFKARYGLSPGALRKGAAAAGR